MYQVGERVENLTIIRGYSSWPMRWRVKCVCGREETIHQEAIEAIQNIGLTLACSECRKKELPRTASNSDIIRTPAPENPSIEPIFDIEL